MGSWAARIRSIKRTAILAVFGTVVGLVLLELLSRAFLPAGEFRVFVVGGSTVFEGDPSLPSCWRRSCTAGA